MLQCGHDPKAVENAACPLTPSARRKVLQCGHDPKAVENRHAGPHIDHSSGLQCGHDPKAVENRPDRRAASRGVSQLQCGHDPKAVENRPRRPWRKSACRSFNAATTRRPWRTTAAWPAAATAGASMRPRPEGRGEPPNAAGDGGPSRLQCGHDPKAVENGSRTTSDVAVAEASMRPRPEGRGEPIGDATARLATQLQCGHDPKAVENRDV